MRLRWFLAGFAIGALAVLGGLWTPLSEIAEERCHD